MPTIGSAAETPQTETGMPRDFAASMVVLMSLSTAGFVGWYRRATASLPRSAAMTYCTRSFVPIEKKSTSLANAAALIAADGTSTIMPTGMSWS